MDAGQDLMNGTHKDSSQVVMIANLVWLIVAVMLVFSACSPSPVQDLTPLVVQLNWFHQATSAGFYAADQKGYYEANGLAVTFTPGGPDLNPLTSVLDGEAQFGIANADALIMARAEGQPVQAIATIYRRSPVVFMSLAEKSIIRPEQFIGKTIRVAPDLAPTLHAMTTHAGVSPDEYNEVVLPSDVAEFATGEVPVWGGFLNGLAVEAENAGYQLNYIYPDDYGVHFYGLVIFTTDELIAEQPELVQRFLSASLQGWMFVEGNPTGVGSMVAHYDPEVNAALEDTKMVASLPLLNMGEDDIGWMKPEIWSGMEMTLREQGVLTKPVDISSVYTLQFLHEYYQ